MGQVGYGANNTYGMGQDQLTQLRTRIAELEQSYRLAAQEATQHYMRVQTLEQLAERLKQEAQIHAMEARTANATIAEIYQCVSGATGEPGNWHGAEPVRKRIESLEQLAKEMDAALNGTVEWDKRRKFIMPYSVRDPIHAAQKRFREVCGGEK